MSQVTHLPAGGQPDNSGPRHAHDKPGETDFLMESVGQHLNAARLKRGDDLVRISRALRIRKDYLEAIESDSPDKLPGRPYALGFLRSYADYLGLDTPTLVSRYKSEVVGSTGAAPQTGQQPETAHYRSILMMTAVAIGALAVVVYGFYELSRPASPGRTDGASTVPVRNVGAAAVARPPARLQAEAGKHLHADTVGTVPSKMLDPQHGQASVGQVFGAQNLNARIILHARGLAHVLVESSDGKIYINRLLHPGDVYRVPNLVGLSLTTPNGAALSVELDGRDMGLVGRSGQVTEGVSLDPRSFADRNVLSRDQGDKVTQ